MRGMRLFGVFAMLALVLLGSRSVQAQGDTERFTLQPGGTAVISFEAFCTEFGELFPDAVQGPSGLAPDAARAAMAYGVNQGLNADGQQALQLQYAIWQALGEAGSPAGDATAQDVVTNGTAAPVSPSGATSVLDAAAAGDVTVTLDSWEPIGPEVAITQTATDNFYGRGQLTVTNTSQQELTLYMPVGTLFPSVDESQQTMAGYATDVQVNNPVADPAPQQQLPATGATENAVALLALAALALVVAGVGVRMVASRVR
jgi:hypothetical protein